MRHRRRRLGRRGRLKRPAAAFLLGTVLMALVCWLLIDSRLRPVVERYSRNEAERAAALALDRAATAALAETDSTQLIEVRRDDSGNIQSVEADMARINRLKAAVTEATARRLSGNDMTLHIPLGTLTGSDLFTGRGPTLPIRIHYSATVLADLESRFESAGINQTNHQLWLRSQVITVCAISGFRQITVQTQTAFLVSETVLVGTVPETYASLGKILSGNAETGTSD